MKKILTPLAVAAVVAGFAAPEEAAAQCLQSGVIISVEHVDEFSGTTHLIRYMTSSLEDHYYEAETGDNSLVLVAAAALTSQAQVRVATSDASCPGGGSGARPLGQVNLIDFD